jgi:hypothetical protein
MKGERTTYFGGLWTPIREQRTAPVRPAILFLGDCYFVRFHLNPADKSMQISSRTYVIEGDVVHHSSMNPEEEGDDVFTFRWRLLKDGRLQFNEKGRKTLWEPVTAEEMAEEGYPKAIFEKYRKAYANEGFFHSIEGRVVEASTSDEPALHPTKTKKR